MAVSSRNQLGVGGSRKLSALEAQLPESDYSLHGVQPLGYIANGNCFGMPSHYLINDLGTRFILTAVTTTGSATNAVSAATSALPPFVTLTTGTTQHDNLQLQYASATTAGSTSAAAHAPFIAKTGYNISFFARFQITTTVANASVFMGLAGVDTTVFASSVPSTNDMIGFYKAAASTMVGYLVDDTAATSKALTVGGTSGWTPTISTWYDLGFTVVDRTSVIFYVNGEATNQTTVTNIPDNDALLCPSIVVSAGTAAAATLQVQAFSCFQEAR